MRNIRWIAGDGGVAAAVLVPGSASAAPGTWKRVTTMPVGYLAYADATRGADGRLYVVGGPATTRRRGGARRDLCVHPATRTGSGSPTCRRRGRGLAVVSAGGLLYAMGGDGCLGEPACGGAGVPRPGRTNRVAPDRAAARAPEDLRAVVSGGRIYVFGGWNGARATTTVWRYDPAPNAGRRLATMPSARLGIRRRERRDGRIYVAGGYVSGDFFHGLQRVDVFNPAPARGRRRPMPTGRSLLDLVRGADGKLYAIGGCCDETLRGALPRGADRRGVHPGEPALGDEGADAEPVRLRRLRACRGARPNGRMPLFGGEPTSGEDWPYSDEVDAFTP